MHRIALTALFLTLCACASPGRPGPAERSIQRLDGTTIGPAALTAEIDKIVQAARVHGLAVTVFNHGAAVYSQSFGFADVKTGRPLRLDTEIYGASLSKAVFAVLVLRLVEKGVLTLDRPLQDYFDTPFAENKGTVWHEDLTDLRDEPRYRKITARMCLAHTTGLPNWRWFEPDEKLRIHFEPGTRYSYSGEGFTFLQVAIEKLTGKPLEQLMREEVFGPFGMSTSSYAWQPRFEADYAIGHRANGDLYPRDKDNAPRGPSTLETTPREYSHFLEGALQGKVLSRASWKEIFTPQIRLRSRTQFGPGAEEETSAYDAIQLSYGLGWGLLRTPHGWGAFKEGHGDGFQHYFIVFPESGLGVLLMSNSDNAESAFGPLLQVTLADTYRPLDWEGYIPYDRRAASSSP